MGRSAGSPTRVALIEAAEVAFANHGFAASSLRQIVAAAGVNLAAIHYHFGSKEALIEAVFTRRLGPVNDRRLRWLDEIEAATPQGPLPLEEVVRALLVPALDMATSPDGIGACTKRIYGRVIAEPSEMIQQLLTRQFGHVVQRFTAALSRALPGLPREVVVWRMYFAIGSMAQVMCDPGHLRQLSGGLCDPSDTRQVVAQLVTFLSAGWRAPVPPAPPQSEVMP